MKGALVIALILSTELLEVIIGQGQCHAAQRKYAIASDEKYEDGSAWRNSKAKGEMDVDERESILSPNALVCMLFDVNAFPRREVWKLKIKA